MILSYHCFAKINIIFKKQPQKSEKNHFLQILKLFLLILKLFC